MADHASTPESAEADAPVRRQRRSRADRQTQILEEATKLFADQGFEANTTELALRLGVTQPLLYRYFPSKEALIESVYRHVFPVARFPIWEQLLVDRRKPLRDRLIEFYNDFVTTGLTYTYMRLILWADVARPQLNQPYYEALQVHVFGPIARELFLGIRGENAEPTERDLEIVRSLHGTFYHLAIRKSRHARPLKGPIGPLVRLKVDLFLQGATELIRTENQGT